jgi:hypothetical protein
MKFGSHLLTFIMCWLSVSCGTKETLKESPHVNVINSGQEMLIILPENHEQGATWNIAEGHNSLVVRVVNSVWHGNEKGIYFHLKALQPGEDSLILVKRFFTDTIDLKRFNIRVKAR